MPFDSALLTDAFRSVLRAAPGAARRERLAAYLNPAHSSWREEWPASEEATSGWHTSAIPI
jgi:hypothetical protein